MKKRIVAGVLALVMVLGLAGCGDQAIGGSDTTTVSNEYEEVVIDGITYKKALDMTSDKITLTYFHFDQEETINYLAERFQEIYPNITVNAVKYTGNDYGGALLSLANNDQMPDVFMTYDCDYALSNQFYADISGFWNTDEETKNLADTVNASGLGCYGTNARFAVPVKFFPGIMFVDNNVLKTLNQTAPTQQWTWSDMISLIKKCTIMGNDASDTYYGLGFYNRLDSYYGIASSQSIHGEFGFDGTDFDLSAWAVGEQEFAGLRQMGYVAPRQNTIDMEYWMGDITAWEGATGHVAMFSEAFWTYQNLWATEAYDQYNLDIVPYVVPAVSEEDASADHHTIATIDFGGVSDLCTYKREAYELLKFMSFGVDGWMTKIQAYNNPEMTNASGLALKHDSMPVPITKNEAVWDAYIDMYCADMDAEHKALWENYFASCMQPIPFGWTSIAGYWNYCDQYFNKIGIHDLVDGGSAKAADFVEEATIKANWYHADAMITYFGPNGYDVLTEEQLKLYEDMRAANGGDNGGGTGEESTEAAQ